VREREGGEGEGGEGEGGGGGRGGGRVKCKISRWRERVTQRNETQK
jgi:hypothetical protein